MPPIRRFAIFAVLVLAGGLALAGCGNTQPGTAAYVGDTRYTEDQVDEIVDEIGRSIANTRPPRPREQVVSLQVLVDLTRRELQARSLAIPPANYSVYSRQVGLPVESVWVRLLAEFDAVASTLFENVQPVTPTDTDLREIYDVLALGGGLPEGTTYEQVAEILRTNTNLPRVLGIRNALREQAADVGVVVNPRYRPLTANIGDGELPMPIVLGEGSDVVTDLQRG